MLHDFIYQPLKLDDYFDKIFYINLPKDTMRNAKILNQFKKFNINNFERIEAIELSELPGEVEYRNFNKKIINILLVGSHAEPLILDVSL